MKIATLLIIISASFSCLSQLNYKEMMTDMSINFYGVCEAADLYFETHPKGKGSGWKGYQRWKNDNEYKYYPSGDRNNIDPYFVKNQFEQFQQASSTPKSLFPTGWKELGPISPGQITGHYAFGMGRIVTFYVDPNNSQRLYLGTKTGGFWKSLNGGTTWTGGSTDFLTACGVSTIAVSPTNPDSVLININNSQNATTHGIYRSIDGGSNWILSNFNPTNLGWGGLGTNSQIFKIKYHPTIPNLIFIGTKNGLYRSDNNLSTWSVSVANDDFTDIDFHPTNPNIVYAYAKNTPNNVFVSTDAGLTFTTVAIPGSAGGVGTVAVSPDCPDCVYYMSGNGLWKSSNSGVSFTLVSNPGESDAGFAVSDIDDSKMIAGYLDAFASSDGGLNFSQVTYWSLGNTNGAGSGHQVSYNTSTDYIHADLQAAECVNGVFYAVTDGFLVNSPDNGTSWNKLSEDIGIRMNYNLGVSQSNHDRTICGSQDNGTSVNTENGWVEMYGADGMEGFIHPLNDDWMIGSLQNGGRRRTKNAGQSNSGATPSGQNAYWIAPIFYDPNEQMRVYSLGESVHQSDDFGSTWTTLGSPSFSSTIKFATIAENNSNLIIAVRNENIELSNDGGVSWIDIQANLPSYSITDVAFDPTDDSTVVVTYGRYQNDNSKVFITHNLGASWQNITYNLGNMPVRSVVIDHTNASTIYLGTEIGLYKKAMSDLTWSLYNTALPNTSIREIEIMWGSNTLRATTWGRGLWEYAIDGRLDFPAITNTDITSPPTETVPKESIDQFVSATIMYDNTISSAYVEWSINAPTFGNVIPMSNVSGNDWVSNTALPDYPAGTKMYFKVFAVGTLGDTTETYKFMYTVKPFEYCAAAGTNDGSNLRITNVTVANINNSTANDSYTYYGNEVVYLTPGSTYSITLTGSTSWSQNDYAAWIDFNKDAIFDTNEAILYEINAGSTTATASFTIPPNAVLEDTLVLRARMGYWYSSDIDPCGSALGEVEDYPVWITCPTLSSTDTHVSCNSYTWIDGNTYTSSNNSATHIITNAAGCDSVLTLNLTINTTNTTITTAGETITADAAGLIYQWIDCSNNSPIIGETNQSFTATTDGDYAVVITDNNNCSDTSNCVSIITIGIQEVLDSGGIAIYPNPTTSEYTIEFGEVHPNVALEVTNNLGQIIATEQFYEVKSIKTALIAEPGVYFIRLKIDGKEFVLPLIKQ